MPGLPLDDTIAALATPAGEGAISVIRLSGPAAFDIASQIFSPKKGGTLSAFATHTLHLGEIRSEAGEVLDQALASIFQAPHSYTAENVVEISLHGSMTVSRKVLDLLIKKGARHAEPGEFTKRAFLNGKIDLTQAEAVLDLIKAKSERSVEAAVRQLAGGLSKKLKSLKEGLMHLYAHMEAFLDFPEEHLEIYSDGEMIQRLEHLMEEIRLLISSFKRGSVMKEGLAVMIAGKPNVGKSSLFNALLERDRALVSEFPGTTRDLLEEFLEIGGVSVRLVDTAGLASHLAHPLDGMSMERTRRALEEAGLYLYLVDGSQELAESDKAVFRELKPGKPFFVIINKCDLPQKVKAGELYALTGKREVLQLSAKTSAGLGELENQITRLALDGLHEAESEQITRLRHKNALESALEDLLRVKASLKQQLSLEIAILDLKSAVDHLRELIGEVYSEDLLDVIFSEFCIGK